MLVRLRLHVPFDPEAVVVHGDPEPLGARDPAQAALMQPGSGGLWEAVAEAPRRFAYCFRVFLAHPADAAPGDAGETPPGEPGDAGETPPGEPGETPPGEPPGAAGAEKAGAALEERVTRHADLDGVTPDADGVRVVDNHWRATLVRFVAHHPLPVGQRLAVVGGHPRLGDWGSPRPMELGDERPLDSGGRAPCWETLVPFTEPVEDLAYRYVVLASEPRWEREPDRHVTVPGVDDVANGLVETADRNVVTGLELDWVAPNVAVGPYPQTPEHVDALAHAGVTAVVNLQTDEDLRHRGVDLERLEETLRQRGVALHRMPIRDFDEGELVRHLPAATALLQRLTEAGRRVYVHCTAGMGRAPAVVLAYLVGQGYALPRARELLQRRHPASAPNVAAVERATERS